MRVKTKRTRMRTAVLVLAAAGLVVAGGAGGAVASHKVTSKQIKNNTIKSKDIHSSGVHNSDIKAHAVSPSKLSAGVRASMGVSGYRVVKSASVTVGPGGYGNPIVACPSGTRPLGGGFSAAQEPGLEVVDSFPSDSGWYVAVHNASSTVSFSVVAEAICARVH